jgi:ABC-type branched-subunit amino acid transport system substrate-binding protein
VTLTEVAYDPTQVKDFAPIVAKFKAANVDTIMGFQFFSDATLFAQAMSSQTWKPKNGVYETGAALSQDAFRRDFAQSADGWVTAMNSPTIDSDHFSSEARKMAEDWPKKHDGATIEGSTAATGASSMTVLVDAIAAAKSTDPKKVAASLRSLSFDKPQDSKYPYYMMAGGLDFNQKQDNEKLIIPWVQVNADKSVTTVFPDAYATGKFRKP